MLNDFNLSRLAVLWTDLHVFIVISKCDTYHVKYFNSVFFSDSFENPVENTVDIRKQNKTASKLQSQLSGNSHESLDSGVVLSNGGVVMGNGGVVMGNAGVVMGNGNRGKLLQGNLTESSCCFLLQVISNNSYSFAKLHLQERKSYCKNHLFWRARPAKST